MLRALETAPALTLAELHLATGLPKPTLLRLLATLEHESLVWRSLGDGSYRATGGPIARARFQPLARAAREHLAVLQRRLLWPSDVSVRRGWYMELVETNRGLSDLSLTRDRIGARIDIACSAVGRAYLAYCPPGERERIIDYIDSHPEIRGAFGPLDRRALTAALEQTRRQGYADRDPNVVRAWRMGEADDHLDAIAVPVLHGRRLIGSLNLVWLRRFQLRQTLVSAHLGELRACAAAIGKAITGAPQAGD